MMPPGIQAQVWCQSWVRTQSRRDHDHQDRSRRDQLHPHVLARDLVPLARLEREAILRPRLDAAGRTCPHRWRASASRGFGRSPIRRCASEPGVWGGAPLRTASVVVDAGLGGGTVPSGLFVIVVLPDGAQVFRDEPRGDEERPADGGRDGRAHRA